MRRKTCCGRIREFANALSTVRFTFDPAIVMNRPTTKEPAAWIAIDGGSTNTRVWLVQNGEVVAKASSMIGVRDSARDGSPVKLRTTVRDLVAQVRSAEPQILPAFVAAAGMITSPLGLAEVPYVAAPAEAEDLARGARSAEFPDISNLPFWLFPGVRCGELVSDEVLQTDVMRGEETLCVGLLVDQRFRPPFTLLNLGSHWKLIRVDETGRIVQSRTSLTGELIHVTQTTTILASGLPAGKLEQLDHSWCARGTTEVRRSGLTRCLFGVRLLEMQGRTSPDQRMSFLLGAYVTAELEALFQSGHLVATTSVILAGSDAVATAWRLALTARHITARQLPGAEIERVTIAGLGELVKRMAHG